MIMAYAPGYRALYEKHLFSVTPSVNKSAFSNSTENRLPLNSIHLRGEKKPPQNFCLNALRAIYYKLLCTKEYYPSYCPIYH